MTISFTITPAVTEFMCHLLAIILYLITGMNVSAFGTVYFSLTPGLITFFVAVALTAIGAHQ